jgi:hypothetical protein
MPAAYKETKQMKLKAKSVVIFTALAFLAPAATAEEQSNQSKQLRNNVPLHQQSQIFFRADKLVGKSAQTPVAQDLGKIEEIAFNPEKGIYGIIKTENDQLVALPWSLVTAVTAKAVVFNTSAEALAGAPTFTDKEWSKLNDPQFTAKLDSHFQQSSAMGGSSDRGQQGVSAGQAQSQQAEAEAAKQTSVTETNALESGSATNAPAGSDSSQDQ